MNLRDELDNAIRVASMPIAGWCREGTCTRLIRDHGQALLDLIDTQESDRASLVSLIAEASVARLALAHCADKSPIYQSAYERVSKAIDSARGKSTDQAIDAAIKGDG